MRKIPYHTLLFAGIFGIVTSVSPTPRLYGSCVYLRRKIYCYGGVDHSDQARKSSDMITMNDFYYLDISGNFTVNNASSAWIEIQASKNSIQPEPNAFYSIGVISEHNTIVINGGIGKNDDSLLVNPTIAYDVTGNIWTAMSGNSGNQMYESTTYEYAGAAAKEYNNSLYIWGGVSDRATGYEFQDFEPDMRILDFTANQWRRIILYANIPTRIYHTSTLGNDKRSIYYIGGQTQTLTTAENGTVYYNKTQAPMNSILVFDIFTGMWVTRNTTGATPTGRLWHTAELKPNSNEIVVYGGASQIDFNTTAAPDDYCCVLDTTAMSWKIVDIERNSGAGIRVGHSAVFLEESSFMFILFGTDENSYPRTDIQILDTNSWNWVQNYQGPGPLADDWEQEEVGSPGLSGGIIAGIVIGAVVGIGAVVSVVFLLLRRRRKKTPTHQPINNSNDMNPPPRYSNDINARKNEFRPQDNFGMQQQQQQTEYYASNQGLAPPPRQHYTAENDGRPIPISSNATLPTPTNNSGSATVKSPRQGLTITEVLGSPLPQRLSIEREATKPDGSQNQKDVPRITLHPVKPDGSSYDST
ncbi:hypothetical protein BDC45DRAFT_568473 [Circinella umbellata]|nr:hypothetical protein BDC45DRAFT_568473 [Circinella umbellata]